MNANYLYYVNADMDLLTITRENNCIQLLDLMLENWKFETGTDTATITLCYVVWILVHQGHVRLVRVSYVLQMSILHPSQLKQL